jgi:hypothetical protein
MNADRDTTRIVRSWLEEGVTTLPDRILDNVLDQLEATPQRLPLRVTRWTPRPSAPINRTLGLGLVAAILVAALVGIQLGGGQHVGGPGPAQSPLPASPIQSGTPTSRPSPVPGAGSTYSPPTLNFDPTGVTGPVGAAIQGGPLDAGTYTYSGLGGSGTGFQLAFTVPAGWTWGSNFLSKGSPDAPGGAAIYFFASPIPVYADPCRWSGSQPAPRGSVDDFIAGLVAQTGRNPSAPITRGDGISVEVTVPVYAAFATCDGGEYRSWGPDADGSSRLNADPGQRDLVWALPTAAVSVATPFEYLVVDAASFVGTPTSTLTEIEAILRTLKVGHWG